MSQYFLSVWHAPGVHAAGTAYESEEQMQAAFARVGEFNVALVDSGAFVTAGGLTPPEEAVTVDATAASSADEAAASGEVSGGTLAEGPMLLGGYWVLEAEDDDAARVWAARASYACGQRVELRRLAG